MTQLFVLGTQLSYLNNWDADNTKDVFHPQFH